MIRKRINIASDLLKRIVESFIIIAHEESIWFYNYIRNKYVDREMVWHRNISGTGEKRVRDHSFVQCPETRRLDTANRRGWEEWRWRGRGYSPLMCPLIPVRFCEVFAETYRKRIEWDGHKAGDSRTRKGHPFNKIKGPALIKVTKVNPVPCNVILWMCPEFCMDEFQKAKKIFVHRCWNAQPTAIYVSPGISNGIFFTDE